MGFVYGNAFRPCQIRLKLDNYRKHAPEPFKKRPLVSGFSRTGQSA